MASSPPSSTTSPEHPTTSALTSPIVATGGTPHSSTTPIWIIVAPVLVGVLFLIFAAFAVRAIWEQKKRKHLKAQDSGKDVDLGRLGSKPEGEVGDEIRAVVEDTGVHTMYGGR